MKSQVLLHGIFILVIVLLASLAHMRNSIWRDELTLWDDSATKAPRIIIPHLNMGNALLSQGKLAEAENAYRRVLNIDPADSRAFNGLGVIYFTQKRYAEAIPLFRLLADDKPAEVAFQYNLGLALLETGAWGEAEKYFKAVIARRPYQPDPHYQLSLAYLKQGQILQAISSLERTLFIDPSHALAKKGLIELQASTP
jgi:tetratricopeptide (TPR) repeat protein